MPQFLSQRRIRRLGIRFNIDQQNEFVRGAIHAAPVLFHTLRQRIEIEPLQRPVGFQVTGVVSHQQLTVDQMDIRLNATKTEAESVDQRMGMFVVVVRVGNTQRMDERFGRFD